jgi:tRNA pseudouridine13 synthase
MIFKMKPEDFIVREVLELPLHDKGRYAYFLLKKINRDSFGAFQEISRTLKLPFSQLGYAGLKDKQAVTEQYLSVPSSFKTSLEKLSMIGISLSFVGYGNERITLGMLEGNTFDIVVRDLPEKKDLHIEKVLNFFDTQRFQGNSLSVGRALVQGNYKEACKLLKLSVDGNDFIGALRTVHRRILRFYLSVYQSWLWNTVVEEVKDFVDNVPLLGYLTEFSDKRVAQVYITLMKKESITLDSFLFKSLPELAFEGLDRATGFTVQDFSFIWDDDVLHPDAYACTLKFFLPKGCYATLVVKHLFE